MKNKRQGASAQTTATIAPNSPARGTPAPAAPSAPQPGAPVVPAAPAPPPASPVPDAAPGRIMQPARNVLVRVVGQPVSTPDGTRFKTDKPFHVPESVARALGGRVAAVREGEAKQLV